MSELDTASAQSMSVSSAVTAHMLHHYIQATAEDLRGPAQRGPQARDDWMTELPPERQATSMIPKGNQTSFSQQGIKSRGDTSEWTLTPAQRLLQLQVSFPTHDMTCPLDLISVSVAISGFLYIWISLA